MEEPEYYNTTLLPIRSLTRKAEAWFARNQRDLPWRRTYDPYHVWLSEIMLQQTRMDVVLGRFDGFLQRFPTLADLANASEDDVTAAWSGLGYYRRARMLRSGAIAVMSRFAGRVPGTVEELMSIDGIGRYTAGAIASIAFEQRAPIVDGNVARVVSRLYATHRDAWPYATLLVESSKNPRTFNQSLMEIGALICKPRDPECDRCPLRRDCTAFQRGVVHRFPKVKKVVTRAETLQLFIVRDRAGRVLLTRARGLFVLPERRPPFAVRRPLLLGTFRHTIMNRRILFEVFATANRKLQTANSIWLDPNELGTVPHPSYVRKALRIAGWG